MKIVESTHIYDNYGMTPVASSHSLARRRSLSADISNEFLSDDDMTIMVSITRDCHYFTAVFIISIFKDFFWIFSLHSLVL